MISMSGDSTKDCSTIAGILPPLYLIFKYVLSNNNNKFENMLKLKYILFVYLLIYKNHLQTQCTYVYFYSKLLLKNNKKKY